MFKHIGLFCSCEGRYCSGCDQIKCHRAFSKDRKGAFGLSSRCKDCIREYQKSHINQINARRRENRQEKADHYNAYNKEFHHRNPEPKRARDRRYRQENIERVRAKDIEYRKTKRTHENYKAKRNEYNREYRQLYPEKNAQHFNNRRARKQQAGGSFTSKEWRKLCARYNFTCLCCGKREPKISLTVDHVVPLSKGGTNFIDNIQPLCISCNTSKGTRAIDYRANWR